MHLNELKALHVSEVLLQARRGTLKIPVIKRQHHRSPIFRIEDLAQAILQAPVILMSAFEEEPGCRLRHIGEIFLVLFVCLADFDIGHSRDSGWFELNGPP